MTQEEIKWIKLPEMPKDSRDDILVWLNPGGCFMGRRDEGKWYLYYSDTGCTKADDYHSKRITHWALNPKGPE